MPAIQSNNSISKVYIKCIYKNAQLYVPSKIVFHGLTIPISKSFRDTSETYGVSYTPNGDGTGTISIIGNDSVKIPELFFNLNGTKIPVTKGGELLAWWGTGSSNEIEILMRGHHLKIDSYKLTPYTIGGNGHQYYIPKDTLDKHLETGEFIIEN